MSTVIEKPLGEIVATGLFDGEAYDLLLCPSCGGACTHGGTPAVVPGNDNYDAPWAGRGDLIIVPFSCEDGCKFEICFGQHKGNTAAFARVKRSLCLVEPGDSR
jgi:hypothetical protein